ncbi:MAG: polysaccharide deacetylase family protein [Pyrinomonadaceae bacterium]|nr:polysaccharide deacetylase family protein [Pyrinomonadaceae bacterium]
MNDSFTRRAWQASWTCVLLLALAAVSYPQTAHSSQGGWLKDVPRLIDRQAKHLFYLHGFIVENEGIRPTSPRYGVYEYEQIVRTLVNRGFVVISEARPKGTNPEVYAAKVVTQIQILLKAGVPPQNITVVGASRGGAIAAITSTLLKNRDVNYVIMAACGNSTIYRNFKVDLWGNILSIYDYKDDGATTCRPFFDKSTGVNRRQEVVLKLGIGHGILYRPLPEWVEPVVEWTRQPRKGAARRTTHREVAVTFDDLPFVSVTPRDDTAYTKMTADLLRSIVAYKVPAVGFVNEIKLLDAGEQSDARVSLLRMWLDADLELGNHTFSHLDLHTTPLAAFQADALRGESVTRNLLAKKKMPLRYFRHPFLHTGRDLETKRAFEQFLRERGYSVAPVTIDNSDWIFAAAYARAKERGDEATATRIAAAYVPYMESYFDYYERQSIALFGRETKQVLLLHANLLNADCFDELADMMLRRGYSFITLDDALQDTAYDSADTFTGTGGISWLHRWALTAGKRDEFFRGEPATPEFVVKEAGL